MNPVATIEAKYRKAHLPALKTGDTVRVHQLIKEGNKQRIQVFEGVIIRRHRMNEVSAAITVRRIASGVGVEKTFLLHSPNVSKVEILRRSKVRRNFLSYLRERRGKSARLQEVAFDKAAANAVPAAAEPVAEDTSTTDEPEVIDEDQSEDALNDAEPLSEVEKAENKAAAAEDTDEIDTDHTDEHESSDQDFTKEDIEEGLDRAEPGEGEAIKS
jgi:large subunit ribosomal protein L19